MSSKTDPSGTTGPGRVEFALLAAISLAWGTSYMFTKIAVGALPPLTLIAARTLIASVAMIVLASVQGGIRLERRDLPVLVLLALASGVMPLTLIAVSVSYVDSSVTATAMALVPVIAAFYASLGGQVPSLRNIVGLAMGFGGIVVLFGPDALLSLGDSARGAMAALGAALIFAGSLFLARRVRHRDALTVATVSQIVSAVFAISLAAAVDGWPPAMPPGRVIAAVTMLGIFNTAAANLLMFMLLARAGATFTSLNNYLVPTVAVFCGTVFLGEPVSLSSFAGAALVLAGVMVATLSWPPVAGTGAAPKA